MGLKAILLVVMMNSLLITNGNAFSKLNALSDARSGNQVHFPTNTHTNAAVDIVKSNKSPPMQIGVNNWAWGLPHAN